MRCRFTIAAALTSLAAACAPQGERQQLAAVQPSPDLPAAVPVEPSRRPETGRAKFCESTRAGRYRADAATLVALTMSNEGGWCAKSYNRVGSPFNDGSIIQQPEHGEARIRHAATRSIIEYRPVPGYVGSDRFTATLSPNPSIYIGEVTIRP